jgi:hypothetical protein
MKKQIAIILTAAVLSVSPALADPVTDLISDHNMNRMLAGAGEITGQPEIEKGQYVYHLQNVDIVISANDEGINSFSCVCLNDSGVGEFLAQCATAFYDIGGTDAFIRCYDPLLSDFLAARAGLETKSNSSVPGVLFQVIKTGSRYIFIIVKVE